MLLGEISLVQGGWRSQRKETTKQILGWGWEGEEEHSRSQRNLTESKKEELIVCQVTKGQMLTQDAQHSPVERVSCSFFGKGGAVIHPGPRTSTKCMDLSCKRWEQEERWPQHVLGLS